MLLQAVFLRTTLTFVWQNESQILAVRGLSLGLLDVRRYLSVATFTIVCRSNFDVFCDAIIKLRFKIDGF